MKRTITPFWNIAIVNEGPQRCGELRIEGTFGDYWWSEVSATRFRQDLEALGLKKGDELQIKINSLGGSVQAGVAIHSILMDCEFTKIGIIESMVASAATFPLCACDVVRMKPGTCGLIHHAADLQWDYMTADDHATAVEDLTAIDEAIVQIYKRKTGKTEEEIIAQMDKGTWMSAEQFIAFGLADEMCTGDPVQADVVADNENLWQVGDRLIDMSMYKMRPVAMLRPLPPVNEEGEVTAEVGCARKSPEGCQACEMRCAACQCQETTCCDTCVGRPCMNQPEGGGMDEEMTAKAGVKTTVVAKLDTDMIAMPRAEFDQALAAAREEGVKAERERNEALDALAMPGTEAMIAEARKNGTTAAEVTNAIIAEAKQSGEGLKFLALRLADANASGANSVTAGVVPEGNQKEDSPEAAIAAAKRNSQLGLV